MKLTLIWYPSATFFARGLPVVAISIPDEGNVLGCYNSIMLCDSPTYANIVSLYNNNSAE